MSPHDETLEHYHEYRDVAIQRLISDHMDSLKESLLVELYCRQRSVDLVVGPEGGIRHGVLFKMGDAEEMAHRIFRCHNVISRHYYTGPSLPFNIGIASVVGQLHDEYLESRYCLTSTHPDRQLDVSLPSHHEVYDGKDSRARIYAAFYNQANQVVKYDQKLQRKVITRSTSEGQPKHLRRSRRLQGLAPEK